MWETAGHAGHAGRVNLITFKPGRRFDKLQARPTHCIGGGGEAIRYGIGEVLHGWDEIGAFRAARSPVGLARTLSRTVITTYGRDFATAATLFHRETVPGKLGRQYPG